MKKILVTSLVSFLISVIVLIITLWFTSQFIYDTSKFDNFDYYSTVQNNFSSESLPMDNYSPSLYEPLENYRSDNDKILKLKDNVIDRRVAIWDMAFHDGFLAMIISFIFSIIFISILKKQHTARCTK